MKQSDEGCEYRVLEQVANRLGLPVADVIQVLGISRQTAYRRKKQNCFRPEEAETLKRLGEVLDLADRVLENPERARSWMTSSARGLGGSSPFSLLVTDAGTDRVQDELLRIEHGVYS